MQLAPFRLLGQSALSAVQTALERAAASWAGQWGVAPSALNFSAARAWEVGALPRGASVAHLARDNGRAVWIAVGGELGAEMQKVLFPSDTNHPPMLVEPVTLAQSGARQACDALFDALACAALSSQAKVARIPADEVPAAVWRRGAGAVLVKFSLGRQQGYLLLDCQAVQCLQAPAPALAPLSAVDYTAAVASTPVSLQLTIGAARVGLGNLLSLSEGDVIRLDSQVDAPIALTLGGAELFHAYLGRRGDSVAVELVKRQSPSSGVKK